MTDALETLRPAVFIVNSDEAARAWIQATVNSAGFEARSFNSAAEFLSSFKPGAASCVILDVVLSDASGFELQQNISRAGASIVFMTREHCFTSCVKAVKAGAANFLTLPCEGIQLIRALRDALREAMSAWSERLQIGELHARYDLLTSRERQVFALVSAGLSNKLVARQLGISEITVQIHRGRVTRKMSARSIASLVRMFDALERSPPLAGAELLMSA